MKKIFNLFKVIHSIYNYNNTPRTVCVNLTDNCNQRCIYCEVGRDYNLASKCELKLYDILWIIDQMVAHNIPKIELYGGEPFLSKDLFKIIKYASKQKVKLTISSNGMLISKLDEDDIKLLKYYNIEIYLSVDSFKDSILSKIRGIQNVLNSVLITINKLQSVNIPITISSVISKYNYQELFSSVVFANELGIKKMSFQPINYYTNYSDRYPIENKAQLNVDIHNLQILTDQLKKILKFQKKHLIKTNADILLLWISSYIHSATSIKRSPMFFEKLLNRFYCWDIFSVIAINYDGNMIACDLSSSKIKIQENKHLGLIELWRIVNKESKKIFIEKKHYFSYCNGCCNHFSRNFLASMIRYPFENRKMIIQILPILINRLIKFCSP
jgi:MoaA/NifB/PqqE/SkfB family radical SAM enzyme